MASVMLFPNVATHRRMPHLSKEPKETLPKPTVDINPQQQQQQQRTTVLPPHSSASLSSASIDRTGNSFSSNTASEAIASSSSTPQQQQQMLTTSGKNHLTLSTSTTVTTTTPYTHGNNNKQIASGASSSSSLPIESTGGYVSTTSSTTGSSVSTPLADHNHSHLNSQEYESSLHGHGGHGHGHSDREHPPQPHLSLLQQQGHLQNQQEQPLNTPHEPGNISNHQHHRSSSSSSSSPFPHAAALPSSSGTPTVSSCPSNTSATHESRLIRSALYDAFGCLYHPVQHTHTPCSPSAHCGGGNSQTGKLPVCAATSSQVQVQLRSGEVTPLIIPSPRAMSPMLRPHLGLSSAPITPLELSSEDGISSHGYSHSHGAAGYFGIVHGHGSASGSSSSSSRQMHQHLAPSHYHTYLHGHGHGQQPQQQHPFPPVPSLLSRTASFNRRKQQQHPHYHHHPQEDSHHHHHDSSTGSKTSSNLLSRKSSLGDIHLDPTEHPVLCSLQTLSLTHPHPANHYHPHLGHDLGHDRVSISDPGLDSHDHGDVGSSRGTRGMVTMPLPLTPSGVLSKTTGHKG